MLTSALAAALFLCGTACAQSQINFSQDLVALGIAGQNAAPNSPNQDTRPLLQAAIQYAVANGIPKVIADQGALLSRMSGSGATCFGLFQNGTEAERAAAAIRAAHPGWWSVATRITTAIYD